MQNRFISLLHNKGRHKSVAGYLPVAGAVLSLLLFTAVFSFADVPQRQPDRKEEPIALVNGTPIYLSDLNCAVEAWNFSTHNSTGVDVSGMLNRLIVIELLYQESLKHRFHGLVGDAEELFRREVQRSGGEEKLRSVLQCNNISMQQFRQLIFRNLAINRLLDQKVYSRIEVTEEEVGEYYAANMDKFRVPESVRLRQIFIRLPNTNDEKTLIEVQNRVKYVFRKAAEGSDFVMLARKYSDDPSSATLGGEMGVIYRGNLHNDIDSLIFSRGEGAVTEPIESPGGFRIFQVVSTSPPVTKTLDEVRSRIVTQIRRSKARSMISEYVSTLRENADIRILKEEYGN